METKQLPTYDVDFEMKKNFTTQELQGIYSFQDYHQ